MHSVKKTCAVSYAHRLLNYNGKCENLHGHNGKVELTVGSAGLNVEGMVEDFSRLGEKLAGWLNANLDHKVVLSEKDPLLKILEEAGQKCFAAKGNPTAELLAETVFEAMREEGLNPSRVDFWETETSQATFEKQNSFY